MTAIDDALHARVRRLVRLREGADDIQAVRWQALKIVYKTDPVKFINDWGMTFDPRNAEIDLPTVVPFMLWPKQREFIEWLYARWRAREDGLTEKSRDTGASWLCVAFAVWLFSFYPGAVAGFGSRKEEYVDDASDPKSLFWKIRAFISYLPRELRPAGFGKQHSAHMRIENPESGAAIVGEAGDNIGRGNRTSIYFVDEAAYLEHPESVDAALSATTNCKQEVSTPNGNAGPFYRRRHAGKVPVFRLHWRDDPNKSDAWYAAQVAKRDDPVIIARELDIDYNASTSDAYIPGDLVAAAQMVGPADVESFGAWIVGVDAAHMGDDRSVITPRKGRLTLPATRLGQKTGPELAGAVIARCDTLPGGVFAIIIELDGPGVSCFDQLKLNAKYGPKTVGVHTGAKLNDQKHYNLRALMWNNAREYLKAPPVSMPLKDVDGIAADLKTQLCSLKYSYKDGLLLMESKPEYKKRIARSPDDADSWVLTHVPVMLLPQPAMSHEVPSVVTAYNRSR